MSGDKGAYMLTEQENAIQNFDFHGLTWGSSVKQMNDLFAQEATSMDGADVANGERKYAVHVQGVDLAALSFLDGKLYDIILVYNPATVNQLGTWDVILSRLVERFGLADADSKGNETGDEDHFASYYWRWDDVKKWISFDVYKKFVKVNFSDLTGVWEMEERKKRTANLGF